MSSSSSRTVSVAVTGSVMVRREFGRVEIGRREVREAARRRLRRVIHAVSDGGAVAGSDELREERVHHVVVERATAAGLVGLTAAGRELDLEERTLLGVRLG